VLDSISLDTWHSVDWLKLPSQIQWRGFQELQLLLPILEAGSRHVAVVSMWLDQTAHTADRAATILALSSMACLDTWQHAEHVPRYSFSCHAKLNTEAMSTHKRHPAGCKWHLGLSCNGWGVCVDLQGSLTFSVWGMPTQAASFVLAQSFLSLTYVCGCKCCNKSSEERG